MSDEVAEGCEEHKQLRRSQRRRKNTVPLVRDDSSGTESVDTETETVEGWTGVETESVRASSEQSQWEYDHSKVERIRRRVS